MADTAPPFVADDQSHAGAPPHDPLYRTLAGSAVTAARLDQNLRYTWIYNPPVDLDETLALGRTDEELYGPQAAPMMALQRRALEQGRPESGAWVLEIGGAQHSIQLYVAPLPGQDDQPPGLSYLLMTLPAETASATPHQPTLAEDELREATVRLARLNAALRASRDLLRALFDNIDDALALIDQHGRLLMLNQPMAALCTCLDRLGQRWEESRAGDLNSPFWPLVAASLADAQARRERIQGHDRRMFDVQTVPLLNDARSLEHLIVHVRDVSEQLRFEARMVEYERFTAHGRLAATVAHEVSTPLQSIESCLHLAERVGDEAGRGRYLRLARDEIRRIGQIMRQMLELYKPDNSHVRPVNLNALVERVLLLTASILHRQKITVDQALATSPTLVLGRADEITQVLINLIMNAIQAMSGGGRLFIATSLEASDQAPLVTLDLADTGRGIASDLLERIFEPFFTTRADGSGLGLAVSRQIIAAHQGRLTVVSTPGEGSRFRICLPAYVSQGETRSAQEE